MTSADLEEKVFRCLTDGTAWRATAETAADFGRAPLRLRTDIRTDGVACGGAAEINVAKIVLGKHHGGILSRPPVLPCP